MAEDKDESQEKTQDPTSRRLEKAKEDGKVVTSGNACFYNFNNRCFIDVFNASFIDDFLKITKSFFNFGPELNSGKSPLESIGAAIKFCCKSCYYLFYASVIICILTQFIVGGINFSLK